jgi:hypothetical protein
MSSRSGIALDPGRPGHPGGEPGPVPARRSLEAADGAVVSDAVADDVLVEPAFRQGVVDGHLDVGGAGRGDRAVGCLPDVLQSDHGLDGVAEVDVLLAADRVVGGDGEQVGVGRQVERAADPHLDERLLLPIVLTEDLEVAIDARAGE